MYEDRIDVITAVGKQTIPLPKDLAGDVICFYEMFYDSVHRKLKVVAACRKDYDVQYVIDEESLELKEKGFFK